MPLPKMIEVVPFTKQQLAAFKSTKAEIVIPGSKSITNRAIVLAAMSEGTVTLNGALWSEDTEAMSDCMQKLARRGPRGQAPRRTRSGRNGARRREPALLVRLPPGSALLPAPRSLERGTRG